MYNLYRIKPLKMLAWWVACSFFIWPLAVIVLGLIAMPTFYVLNATFPNTYQHPVLEVILWLIAVPTVGAIIGICMAFLQRWVLRAKLYWTADKWYLWTVIGGALGAGVTALVIFVFQFRLYGGIDNAYLYMMPIFLAVVSSFQVLALRHAVKQAWLWIIGNIVGGIVYAGVIIGNQPAYSDPNNSLLTLGMGFLAVASMGFITGFVLLFLFEKKLLPMRPDTKDDTDEDQTPKSVWDRAI